MASSEKRTPHLRVGAGREREPRVVESTDERGEKRDLGRLSAGKRGEVERGNGKKRSLRKAGKEMEKVSEEYTDRGAADREGSLVRSADHRKRGSRR